MTACELRLALPADALGVAQVHVRTWQAAYRGLLPDDYLRGLKAEERAQRYTFANQERPGPRTFVALDGESVVGFATVRVEDAAQNLGELAALHVDPAHWNRGIGVELIACARSQLHSWGCSVARLWLLVGNRRAERFYGIDGWSPDGMQRMDRIWGADVHERSLRRGLP